MKNKVLIITYDMIPHASSWGGCQRMYYLSKFLVKRGYDVTVFSCKKHTNTTFGNDICFKTYSLEIKSRFLKKFVYSKGDNTTNIVENKDSQGFLSKARNLIKTYKGLMNFLLKVDAFFYNEPTFLAGPISLNWIKTNYNQIREYIEKEKISTVIVSVPAFNLLRIGELLKRDFKNRICLIYDYRDPWNMWKRTSIGCFNREKRYLKYADKVVCTNAQLLKDMSDVFNCKIEKFSVVSNGYSNEQWEKARATRTNFNNKFVISYIGSIEIVYSGIRNVYNLIDAYRRILNKCPNMQIQFVGVNNINLPNVLNLEQEFGERILFIPSVPAQESFTYMLNSNALLLLHTTEDDSSKYIISGKFYDYIRANKPIMSIGSKNGIHHQFVTEYGLGVSVVDDADAIEIALVNMYRNWEKRIDDEAKAIDVECFSREEQYETYNKIILKNVR